MNNNHFPEIRPTCPEVRLLVQAQFPAPYANWISGLVAHSPLLIPRAMVDCGHGRSLLRAQSQEDFLVWLGAKLKDFETTLNSPFFALGQKLEILYGAKDPATDYYNYLKNLIYIQNQPYNNLLDALVNEYRVQGNLWLEVYLSEHFTTTILPTLMNGNLLKPHAADALANCASVSALVTYLGSAYRTVSFADIPVTKSLLEQMVFSRPSEQLAWVRAYINTNSNGVEIKLSDIFFRTNMSITQLLLNIKNSFDNDTYQSVLQQLQPMQELSEILRYRLSEQPIYGSSRIGVRNIERNALFANYLFEKKHQIAEPEDPTQPLLVTPQNPEGDISTPLTPQSEYSLTLGNKQYELSNHLGNVQVTLTDRKLGVVQNESSSFTHYLADVRSAVDYYPFGMQMPGRSVDGEYRWGMGGHEKDDEVKGSGNHLSFGDYGYDPRLGKRWNVDPEAFSFPAISSYSVYKNNPIFFIDPDGESPISALVKLLSKQSAKAAIRKYAKEQIEKRLENYASKKVMKQFAKDLEDVLATMDDGIWETAFEMLVPVVGDIYGASKFGIKIAKAYDKLQDLENKYVKKVYDAIPGKEAKEKFKNKLRKVGVESARKDQKVGVKEVKGIKYEKNKKIDGHHLDDVKNNPEQMSDPRNIEFMKREDHIEWHQKKTKAKNTPNDEF